MPPDDLARRMQHLWAKGGGSAPLLTHLLDVCGQASRFLNLYKPQWAIPCNLHRVLAYATLLHDFGKIHPGFQAMLQKRIPFDNRHEVLSLAFLAWLEIPDAELSWVAAAIATHHKSWSDIKDGFANDSGLEQSDLNRLSRGIPETDAALLHELLCHAPQIFKKLGWPPFEFYPLREYAPLDYKAHILNALAQIKRLLNPPPGNRGAPKPGPPPERDWRPVIAGIHARGWMLSADHLASFGPQPIHKEFQSRDSVNELYPNFIWKPHQEVLANHEGSALLIAPTGSGKTEAALLWAARQAESGADGRLCILLPYQASLNAMQKRLLEKFDPSWINQPKRWNEKIGLLHGRSARRLYEAFLEIGDNPQEAARKAREQNELARLFAAPVAVSTVFSVIRLLFATRGPERLFVSFSGARIVVDEIHAYDPSITALALAGLKFLTDRLGARVLFMSATVPRHLESALSRTMQIQRVPQQPPWGDKSRHRLTLLQIDSQSDEVVTRIVEAAKAGSVLVVVNQVKRAIQLCERLQQQVTTKLLHARFNLKDRSEIESNLTSQPGLVLIATQTVEVSLDLSFDACFTELAPIESIAQRFGRCNRKGLNTPAPVYVFAQFPPGTNSHRPYDDEHMKTALAALESFCQSGPRDLSDADVDRLLNESYPEQLKQQLEIQLQEKTKRLRELFLDIWEPFGTRKSEECRVLEQQWSDLFDGREVLPASLIHDAKAAGTRMGVARYMVPIAERQWIQFRNQITPNEELDCDIIQRNYGPAGLDLHSRDD